jgi:putative oxidoreductase
MNSTQTSFNKLNFTLWLVQGMMAAMFTFAGLVKAFQSIEQLGAQLPWVNEVPVFLVRFIGIAEFLGGLGLLLPSLLRIKPILTPLAALGIFTIMVLAFIYHVVMAEYDALVINVIFGALALFIAWGRYSKVPISSR